MAKIVTTETELRQLVSKSREILNKETEILRDQNKRISFLISSLKSRAASENDRSNDDTRVINQVSEVATRLIAVPAADRPMLTAASG